LNPTDFALGQRGRGQYTATRADLSQRAL